MNEMVYQSNDGEESFSVRQVDQVIIDQMITDFNGRQVMSEDYSYVSIESIPTSYFSKGQFEPYYNNCAEFKYWQYPAFLVHIIRPDGSSSESLFLKTFNGYRLSEYGTR